MKESISKFLKEGKALLWVKTNDFQEVEKAIIENLNVLESKKFYAYEKGKTFNFQNERIEEEMNDLFTTLDELYPQGIRKIPVFLLIKGGIEEILKKNNLDYIKEIVETKKDNPKYNFTIIVADEENVPPQLEEIADFVDKQIIDNESAIKKYILEFANFEKVKLEEGNIEKIIKELKYIIKKYNGKKVSNVEGKFENMVSVQGGRYTPSFVQEERDVFDIEVSKYLVTQDIWTEMMGSNPSSFKGERRPVESVSWWEALEYCNKLSEKYDLEPVYDLKQKEKGILRINQLGGESKYPNTANFKNTEGFRLPTEVEWEWFARGGQSAIDEGTFDYPFSGSDNVDEVTWYNSNSENHTHDVGLKKPNQLGLYDCSGNVLEWCYDTDSSGYVSEELAYIFDTSVIKKRLRGGSWNYTAGSSIIYDRASIDGAIGNGTIGSFKFGFGFRIVRTI